MCSHPRCLPYLEDTGIGKCFPSVNAVVHDFVYLSDFPLLRLVKGVVQSFGIDQLGADLCAIVVIKERLYQSALVSSGMNCFCSSRSSFSIAFDSVSFNGKF